MTYKRLFRTVLRRIPAETAHTLAAESSRLAIAIPGVRSWLRRALRPEDSLQVTALGRAFPSPLGAAGGMDKGATWFEALGAIGFGFVEVGTITAHKQRGNRGQRVLRLLKDRAVLNRMGFPNPGAQKVARRLRSRSGDTVVGVNIGKSKAIPVEEAVADYRASARRVGPLADYLVLNVSSPNTPGLVSMQAVEPLRSLVTEVQAELESIGADTPLLLKIGPDLSDGEIDAIADLALELKLEGIVATNTTADRDSLVSDPSLLAGGGGISGAPLKVRALEVLRRLHARVEGRLVLISVGGIETPEDAWGRILAGASLLQAYTGFVYGGPLWPFRMNRELAQRLHASGGSTLADVVGKGSGISGARDGPRSDRMDGQVDTSGATQRAPALVGANRPVGRSAA